MAVIENKVTTTVTLKVKTGTKNGKDVFRNISLSKVKSTASAEDIYAVAAGIGSLLNYPVSSILKQDTNELVNG